MYPIVSLSTVFRFQLCYYYTESLLILFAINNTTIIFPLALLVIDIQAAPHSLCFKQCIYSINVMCLYTHQGLFQAHDNSR